MSRLLPTLLLISLLPLTWSEPNDSQAQLKFGGWGVLRGFYRRDHAVFRGIPFAEPPIGPLRFAPPKKWDGKLGDSRSAWRDGVVCPGSPPTKGDGGVLRTESEDCLQLEVWLPRQHAEAQSSEGEGGEGGSLPIMVWLGHGDFDDPYSSLGKAAAGSLLESERGPTGEAVSAAGQVWVSCNWRRGVLGFMAHPDATAEHPSAPTNFGLLDQRSCTQHFPG